MIFHSHVSLWDGRPLFQPIHQPLGLCPRKATFECKFRVFLAAWVSNGPFLHPVFVSTSKTQWLRKSFGYHGESSKNIFKHQNMGIYGDISWDKMGYIQSKKSWVSLKMGYTSTSKCPSNEKEHDDKSSKFGAPNFQTNPAGFPLESLINYWTNPTLCFSLMRKLRVFLKCSILISLKRIAAACFKGWEHAVTRNGYPAVIKQCNGRFPISFDDFSVDPSMSGISQPGMAWWSSGGTWEGQKGHRCADVASRVQNIENKEISHRWVLAVIDQKTSPWKWPEIRKLLKSWAFQVG